MTVEISEITVSNGTASFKLHNLGEEFAPTGGIIRIELYRDPSYEQLTLIMHIYSDLFTLFEYVSQLEENLKSYKMKNGKVDSIYFYPYNGGFYKIYNGGKVGGQGVLIGSGVLPEFEYS
jgi:hypothetical protein